MMNNRTIVAVAVSVAVIAASVAAIVITNNNSERARQLALKASNEADAAASAEREAKLKANAERSHENIAKAEAKKAEDDAAAAKAMADTEQAAARRAADERKTAEANASAAADSAKAAENARLEAKAKADEAKAMADAVRVAAEAEVAKSNAVAMAAADSLATEKLKSEKTIAAARLLELQQTDFETWQRNLLELEQELSERERALTPDKTSADLTWVAEREADEIGGASNMVGRVKKVKVLPEDDVTLPSGSRLLARTERLARETDQDGCDIASNRVIRVLTRLYSEAVRDGRIIDAQYYRRSIKYFYPNWEYKE